MYNNRQPVRVQVLLLLALLVLLAPITSAASQGGGGFVAVQGDQLVLNGETVTLKGVNYYPQGRPWAEMWQAWDAPGIERELRHARDTLGINTIRVLLPYDLDREEGFERLYQVVQIAGSLDVRVIVTLFDFDNSFPVPNSAQELRQVAYLEDLLPRFAGDDRILAWDIHNEPDNYPAWTEGGADRVLLWLSRMATHIKRLAPNHLVTVGMGQYQHFLLPGPDGQRVVDYTDFVSLHTYNAPDLERQVFELRQATGQPIVLGEFGWPSGPGCELPDYNEQTQEWVYRTMLEGAERQQLAGVVAWTLRDFDAGPTLRWDTREEYYGLIRPDDSLKPAANLFAAVPAPPLASSVQSSVPLTQSGLSTLGGKFAPIQEPITGYYLKGWFRIAWEELGGRGTFGLPLGNAYIRLSDQRVVQFFEAAVLEYRPERGGGNDWGELTRRARALRLIQPMAVGQAYTEGRQFSPPAAVPPGARVFSETGFAVQGDFLRFYEGAEGMWRLGAPISQEREEIVNGVPTRVQYFQQGRLEANPTNGAVQYGQLGSWLYTLQCTPAQ